MLIASTTAQVITSPIVVGTDGSPEALHAVRDAALLAAHQRVELHIVSAYALKDACRHRMDRVVAPRDLAHQLDGRGEAEALLREAVEHIHDVPVRVHLHAVQGRLKHVVKRLGRRLGAARLDHLRSPVAAPSPRVAATAPGRVLLPAEQDRATRVAV